ncbi:hypothetical protein DI14_05810 [Exiguobacterium sp. AB2]|nr:hypothetical protein DI14_05810 [Exiguobacterium sp. AB2]
MRPSIIINSLKSKFDIDYRHQSNKNDADVQPLRCSFTQTLHVHIQLNAFGKYREFIENEVN